MSLHRILKEANGEPEIDIPSPPIFERAWLDDYIANAQGREPNEQLLTEQDILRARRQLDAARQGRPTIEIPVPVEGAAHRMLRQWAAASNDAYRSGWYRIGDDSE